MQNRKKCVIIRKTFLFSISDTIFRYEWYKNGEPFAVDNDRVIWQKAGQSGTIVVLRPETTDQGFYQCRAINIFGVAMSNIFEVRLGGSFIRFESYNRIIESKKQKTA